MRLAMLRLDKWSKNIGPVVIVVAVFLGLVALTYNYVFVDRNASDATTIQPGATVQERKSLPLEGISQHEEDCNSRVQVSAAPANTERLDAPLGSGPVGSDGGVLDLVVVDSASARPMPYRPVLVARASAPEIEPPDRGANEKETWTANSVTDGAGRAQFAVPAEVPLQVIVLGDETVTTSSVDLQPLGKGEARSVVITVDVVDESLFYCRVTEAGSSNPIAGAVAFLLSPENRNHEEVDGKAPGVLTDSNGIIAVRSGILRPSVLCIHADGFAGAQVSIDSLHAAYDNPFEVVVSRCSRIDVIITGYKSAPASNLMASARSSTKPAMERHSRFSWELGMFDCTVGMRVMFDAMGLARLDCLSPTVEYSVDVVGEDSIVIASIPSFTLAVGEHRTIRVDLSSVSLDGIVLDQWRNPVSNRRVWMVRATKARPRYFSYYEELAGGLAAQTDDAGRFEVQDVMPGKWLIGPALLETPIISDVAAYGMPVEVFPALEGQSVQLMVSRDLGITGRVVDQAGQGIGGVVIVADPLWAEGNVQAVSSSEGLFQVAPLMAGNHKVSAVGAGWAATEPVEAPAGTMGLLMRVSRGEVINGRILLNGQLAMIDATVLLTRLGADGVPRPGMSQNTVTGLWRFDALSTGRYYIFASTAENYCGSAGPFVVVGGSDSLKEIDIELALGARIRIGFDGLAVNAVYCIVWQGSNCVYSGPIKRGEDVNIVARPGLATVVVLDAEQEQILGKTIDVAAGKQNAVEF